MHRDIAAGKIALTKININSCLFQAEKPRLIEDLGPSKGKMLW